LIILDKKVIYIKIPKTGSSTITTSIWDHYGMERQSLHEKVVNLNFLAVNGTNSHWHVRYKSIEEYLGAETKDFVSFSIIREPMERLISAYRWSAQKAPQHPILQSYEVFLETLVERPESLPQLVRIWSSPQVFWLKNKNGEIPPDLKIFTLDQIAECVPFFDTHLGFVPEFGRVNESVKRPVEITDRAKAIVDGLYFEDFELFNKHRGEWSAADQ
jgi:Sulfotransferase family